MNTIKKLLGKIIYWRHQESFEEYLKVHELTYKPGYLEIYAKHPMVPELADALIRFFDNAGGINYVSFSVAHPKRGRFTVTVTPERGKPQYEIISELKERTRQLEAVAEAVESEVQHFGVCPLCRAELDPFDGIFEHGEECPMVNLGEIEP
jgi:DNA-directed RNA polymerase subunit L